MAIPVIVAAALVMAGCDRSSQGQSLAVSEPTFEDARLASGRSVWMNTCRACHLRGVAGAPAITDAGNWKERRRDGRESLLSSALEGIPEGNGWSMPPRGGNPRLTDDEVGRALDYMLAAVDELDLTTR
jgi:cytochrome c5